MKPEQKEHKYLRSFLPFRGTSVQFSRHTIDHSLRSQPCFHPCLEHFGVDL
jgi:hypothetical protein